MTRGSEFGVFANAPASASSRVPRAFSRAELASGSRTSRRSGARRGSRTSCTATTGRSARRSRSSSPRTSSRRSRPSPATTLLFGADEPDRVARVLGVLRVHLGTRARAVDDDAFELLWITDFPMFEWSTRTRRAGRAPPSVHAARARLGGRLRRRSRQRARGRLRPRRERQRARRRLDQDPRAGATGAGLRRAPAHAGRAAREVRLPPRRARDGRAAARRLRVRDRPDADGASPASRTSATSIAFPKNQAGIDPMSGRAVRGDGGAARRARHPPRRAVGRLARDAVRRRRSLNSCARRHPRVKAIRRYGDYRDPGIPLRGRLGIPWR